jgi:Rod binding domain-containing protein
MITPLLPILASPAPEAADLRSAGLAFEALFLQQMLRDALPDQEGSGALGLQALATQLAQGSPFGIARLLGRNAGEAADGPAEADLTSATKGPQQP